MGGVEEMENFNHHTWLPVVEESDWSLTLPTFPDSKKPAPSRAGPREPCFPICSLLGSLGKVV